MQKKSGLFLSLFLFGVLNLSGQLTRKVLFLGNSYTGYNNLPQMVKDVALSTGDTLVFDNHNPGGYRLEDHFFDPTVQTKMAANSWDYLVLQGQSREPILGTSSFKQRGRQLKQQFRQQRPCGVVMLYMTWGRQNGDATFCPTHPEMCTYQSMDSTLRVKYEELAQDAGTEISPVSAVWRYLRQYHGGINLYQSDGSHPSVAGSYATACSFYTMLFKKNPMDISFDAGLNASEALAIRQAAKSMVYDSLTQWDYQYQPRSTFRYTIGSGTNEVIFSPINFGVTQDYLWDFGDGNTSTLSNPTHSYAADGVYTVTLTTSICNLQGVQSSVHDTVISFCSHTPSIFSNTTTLCNYDTLWTQAADAYQWYSGGVAIPETQRFLANYQQYNSFSFTVRTTLNGCAELSQPFGASPTWSGYYYDAGFGGNPCLGDTVTVALRNNFGFSGAEIIRWFRNGTRLNAFDDMDTMLINTSGYYEGYVVDPTSNCPFDTTWVGPLNYQCLSTEASFALNPIKLYPNPATTLLHLDVPEGLKLTSALIYNTSGLLIQRADVSASSQIDISRLPTGVYYLRFEEQPDSALKFVKDSYTE